MDPAGTEPAPPTVVTLGDSVPAGTGCGCTAFPDLYAQHEHAVSVNLAEAGLTSADVRAQLEDPQVRDSLRQTSEVLLMVGANDVADTFTDPQAVAAAAAELHTNIRATLDAIQRIHPTTVIVLGYWNVVRDGEAGVSEYGATGVKASAETTDAINDELAAAAEAGGATYVSTDPAFHGADGEKDPTALLIADGDHPDAAGHTAIAQLIPPMGATS
ncbi:lysophospholipase L1-like esterase [Couchioplanes caeruleus]|uniref:Acylhydrolase n=3 Tax=Couchioplanes caeruleus TaxID=56438 RepID=A0A1K0GC96_9ACTN|nr:acylhydrolase [Couchioplanes caeruleus subsp. caeruleus]ROP32162.1 lysophospholipase L1-like esterase [Couchioplanes caeruleus]